MTAPGCCHCERGECRWLAELAAELETATAQLEKELAGISLDEIAPAMTDRELAALIDRE